MDTNSTQAAATATGQPATPHINPSARPHTDETIRRARAATEAAKAVGRPGEFTDPTDRDATFGIAVGHLQAAMKAANAAIEAIENDWPTPEQIPATNTAIAMVAAEVGRAATNVAEAGRMVNTPFVAKEVDPR